MPLNIIYKEDIARRISQAWGCEGEDICDIVANISIRRFKKNDYIYNEHQTPTRLIYLVRGKVKIVKDSCAGRPQIVRAINEGQFLGYRAFFAHEEYITSALAFEDSIVATLPFCFLKDMLQRHCGVAKYFIRELATTLGSSDSRIVSLTQKHIRGRLAETILSLKDNYGVCPVNNTINISMSRDDIASLSNMSTSNAIRTLSAFAQEGIIMIEGKKIRIVDQGRLHKISEMG